VTRPILIAGPTASGKSELAVELARATGGLVVNADALQVYAGWRILTARPDVAMERAVPHHLFGHVGMEEKWSAGHWLRAVTALLADPAHAGRVPVFVGGTGLYFLALTEGLAEIPPIPGAIRARGNAMRRAGGAAVFLSILSERDPQTLAGLDRANPMRLQRAWEVLEATGKPLSAWQAETPPPLVTDMLGILLDPEREALRERIAARFDAMLAAGALDEVRANLRLDPDLPSMQALGAPQLRAHLLGETTLEAAREAAITATHQYARRQRSWFRSRMKRWRRFDPADPETLAAVRALIGPKAT